MKRKLFNKLGQEIFPNSDADYLMVHSIKENFSIKVGSKAHKEFLERFPDMPQPKED